MKRGKGYDGEERVSKGSGGERRKEQGGHKPGDPAILRDFHERWKLREFCATSGKTNFMLWVKPASSNPYAAKCIWCTKTVELSNLRQQAVDSHVSSS